jgi:hypothetical protein
MDLIASSFGLQPTSKRAYVFPEVPLIRILQERGHPYRVFTLPMAWAGFAAVYNIEEAHGYDAYFPKRSWRMGQLSKAGAVALQPAYATPCWLFPVPDSGEPELPRGLESEGIVDGLVLAKDTRALPRARLVSSIETFASTDAMFARMEQPGFDPAKVVFADVPLGFHLPKGDETLPGEARITKWGWNIVDVEFDATRDAVLVLADAYYPGWEAHLDDKTPLEIFPAYHLFRGVQVPAGRHTIEFEYRPFSFRLGAILSVAALLLLLVAAVVMLAKRPGIPGSETCAPKR